MAAKPVLNNIRTRLEERAAAGEENAIRIMAAVKARDAAEAAAAKPAKKAAADDKAVESPENKSVA